MHQAFRTAVAAAAIATAALSLTLPAQAGPRSAVGAGLVGFGIGAILGSMMAPPDLYFGPPPPGYYGPAVYGPPEYDGPVAYGPPNSYRPRSYYYGPPGSYRPRSYGPPPGPDRYGDRASPRPKTQPPAASQVRRPILCTSRIAGSSRQGVSSGFTIVVSRANRGKPSQPW